MTAQAHHSETPRIEQFIRKRFWSTERESSEKREGITAIELTSETGDYETFERSMTRPFKVIGQLDGPNFEVGHICAAEKRGSFRSGTENLAFACCTSTAARLHGQATGSCCGFGGNIHFPRPPLNPAQPNYQALDRNRQETGLTHEGKISEGIPTRMVAVGHSMPAEMK